MSILKRIIVVLIATAVLLTACSGQSVIEVEVTLTEFGIQSPLTEFQAGIPYRFVVTNAGLINHEFMVMPPLTDEQMGMTMDMHELDVLAFVMIEADDLAPGRTNSVEITFAEPAPVGTLEFACHTENHYQEGMKLPITVK